MVVGQPGAVEVVADRRVRHGRAGHHHCRPLWISMAFSSTRNRGWSTALRQLTGLSVPQPPGGAAWLSTPSLHLRRALDALTHGAGDPGGALHRRGIDTSIFSVVEDGTAIRVVGAYLQGSVVAARPSVLVDGPHRRRSRCDHHRPDVRPSARDLGNFGIPGHPARTRPVGKLQPANAGMNGPGRRSPTAGMPQDKPAGAAYHLDGRNITDGIEGFYCAIGEAMNGPAALSAGMPTRYTTVSRGGWGAVPTRPGWSGTTWRSREPS